jgi:hypothetical protein
VSVARDGDRLYDATVIVGATNVENVVDVERLAPGTLVVDDSWPHCMNGPAALARFTSSQDILFTEGGFVRSRAPMRRLVYQPAALGDSTDLTQLLFASLDPQEITACVLSALISAQRDDLPPTIGLVEKEAARQHWNALGEFGCTAAELRYEGHALDGGLVRLFQKQFGATRRELQPV